MRIYRTSRGLNPALLVPGQDLVLELEPAHGLDVPQGVLAHDHLSLEDRRRVDAAATDAFERWSKACGEQLTVEGVRLGWVWEGPLLTERFLPLITDALAVDRAIEHFRPSSITTIGLDPTFRGALQMLAKRHGTPFAAESQHRAPPPARDARSPSPVRVRRRLIRSLARLGVPSRPRRGSVLVLSYWPLRAVLDRMLAGEGPRPAVWLDKLPAGPTRSLRAAMKGGWIGLPGPLARFRARRVTRSLHTAAGPSELDVLGLPLGPFLHALVMQLATERAARDLALARLFRRIFGRGNITKVLVPYDIEPRMRLIVSLAREAGVPTLLVSHGAYPLRHTVVDMQVSDEIAAWSTTFGPTVPDSSRPVHTVGYPVPHEIGKAKPAPVSSQDLRVLVLGHGRETQTALWDDRHFMRFYSTAVAAAAKRLPSAAFAIRPHPNEGPDAVEALRDRRPDLAIELDDHHDVMNALLASDLCIGAASTTTFQAALVGTPVIVLNLSGYEWCWPLGGDTSVPIMRSEAELADHIGAWLGGAPVPGREDLLTALGAGAQDAPGRVIELLSRGR